MSAMQKKYYKWILTKDSKALSSAKSALMNVIVNLRKACNHPYLFNGAEPLFDGEYKMGEHLVENSGKMVMLDKLLNKFLAEDHKGISHIPLWFTNTSSHFFTNDAYAGYYTRWASPSSIHI